MTADRSEFAGRVARYASRLHLIAGDRHHVASPLGAWLLLALAGPASAGQDRARLAEALGCDVDSAAGFAAELLGHPHPLIASAAAVWTLRGVALSSHFRHWRDALPAAVDYGDLPGKAALDAWVREHTFGLIDQFPLDSADDVYLLLASALATKVSWEVPFRLTPAADLGAGSPWSSRLSRVLRTPEPDHSRGHRQFIAATAGAGDVAVHAAAARDGLLVYSVAAAPAVPFLTVLAAAHEIGCADAVGAAVGRRDLKSLPLGDGPAWVLREEPAGSDADVCTAVLPAWSAHSDHDLARPGLGFQAAASALLTSGDEWVARQAAMARYTRTGFEAAAVTMMAGRLAVVRPDRTRRVAELRFGHPYAVVAIAVDPDAADGGDRGRAAWHGMPVFSAWVAEPDDAGDDDAGDDDADPAGAAPRRAL